MNEVNGDSSARLLGNVVTTLFDAPVRMATALAGAATQATSRGCEIPPPCWEPRRAGVCRMVLTPGGTGTVRLQVTNCGWDRHIVALRASGTLASWITLSPTTVVIGPQDRATMLASIHVPDRMKPGLRATGLLLVRGCRDHVVRLEVAIAECADCAGCTVPIDDCADYLHHWYDHFYCYRPCRNRVSGVVDQGRQVLTHG